MIDLYGADNQQFIRITLLGLLSSLLFFICLVHCIFAKTKYTHYEEQTNRSYVVAAPGGSGAIVCHAGPDSNPYPNIRDRAYHYPVT